MNADFHYYATYCAAILAGYSPRESVTLATADRLVDQCTKAFLSKIHGPVSAATTQQPVEMADAPTDIIGLQDITRIWASFHFLPRDLTAQPPGRCGRRYRNKYRLLCGPNSPLVEETVRLAKDKGLPAAGIAMHVLADTWAHQHFAGTPSQVINNTNYYFYEQVPGGDGPVWRKLTFTHNALSPDDLEKSEYTNSLSSSNENSIMNLGHGRAGHLPDYSFAVYKYLPAWGGYREMVKDNPSDYYHAFTQMITAMKYLRGQSPDFTRDTYDLAAVAPYEEEIRRILATRQLSSSDDWKALGERLSGQEIPPYDLAPWEEEYLSAPAEKRDSTVLGQFILGALAQKSMVTHAIYTSGNPLAGTSIDYQEKGFRGIRDFIALIDPRKGGGIL